MLAASSARYLFFSDRKHDIEVQEQRLSNDKISLARDSEKVYQDYNNALKQKSLKFSNNAGYSYTDVSYSNLMRPGTTNLNEPYIVTDMQGRVVVDEKYLEYAKMISSNGYAGGDWSESTRAKVLSKVTGISEDKILNADTSSAGLNDAYQNYYNVMSKEPTSPYHNGVDELINEMMKSSSNDAKEVAKAYNGAPYKLPYSQSGSIAVSSLKNILNQLSEVFKQYFNYEGNEENYADGCKLALKDLSHENDIDKLDTDSTAPIYREGAQYVINFQALIDTFIAYVSDENNTWVDTTSTEYKTYLSDHEAWEKEREAAEEELNNESDVNNQQFTSEQEAMILFYDKIFSSIAENGWVYNDQVSDTNYLNQVLQNGNYSITRVSRLEEYDEDSGKIIRNNDYETDIATNFDNIVTVSDTEVRDEAYIKYQHEKSIIDKKETKIDTKMKNLDAELSAINQMMEAIQNTMKEATDRTFSISS